jgi:hypothetical protein
MYGYRLNCGWVTDLIGAADGNSWETVAGCSGFTAVSDLITHQYLGNICGGETDVIIKAVPGLHSNTDAG